MGTPKQPITWATALTSYPAGSAPWNSQPLRVQPGVDYWTPGTAAPPTAEGVNWVEGGFSDFASAMWSFLGPMPIQNWEKTAAAPGSLNQVSCAVYDGSPNGNRWFLGARDTSNHHIHLFESFDKGRTWIDLGLDFAPTNNGLFRGIYIKSVTSQNNFQLITADDSQVSNGIEFRLFDNNANTWTSITSFSIANATTSHGCDFSTFNGVLIAVPGGTAQGVGGGVLFTSGDSGATWAAKGSTGFTATTVNTWTPSAQSLSIWAIFPRLTSYAGYITSTDGATFTHQTLAGGLLNTGDKASALAHGNGASGNGLFMLAIAVSGGTNTKILTSADALTWTVQSTPAFNVSDIVAYGNLWVACTDTETNSANGFYYYSTDDGVSWHPISASQGSNTTTATNGYIRNRLVAGDKGLLSFNTSAYTLSLESGITGSVLA